MMEGGKGTEETPRSSMSDVASGDDVQNSGGREEEREEEGEKERLTNELESGDVALAISTSDVQMKGDGKDDDGDKEGNKEEGSEEEHVAKQTETILLQGDDVEKTDSNIISTTKYTFLDFFPRAFLLQYRRAGNIFFTVIVIIMILGYYTPLFQSPQSPWGNLSILVIIFGINMTLEGLDDRARRLKDNETNSQPVQILSLESGDFENKTWADVHRGDLVKLEKNNTSPADILIVNTSDSETEAVCYVETANVDGETYLKKRFAHSEIANQCMSLTSCTVWLRDRVVQYDAPSPGLSSFRSVVKRKKDEVGDDIELSADNVLLRGCQLKNTKWIWGVALYTGRDTKSLMARGKTRIKQSRVDKMANKVILTVLVILIVLLVVSMFMLAFTTQPTTELWYMRYASSNSGSIFPPYLNLFLIYLILYRQILPILLYAVQEGLSVIQAKYINWDLRMYDKASGKFATCNTTQLAQEIGQVKWIFSDKTGTLTRNEMRLVGCSVDGKIYGQSTNKALETLATRHLPPMATTRLCFNNALDVLALNEETEEKKKLSKFLKALSLCHTVLVESDPAMIAEAKDRTRKLRRSKLSSAITREESFTTSGRRLLSQHSTDADGSKRLIGHRDSTLNVGDTGSVGSIDTSPLPAGEQHPAYNAESPDEEALVLGSAALGFQFAFTEGESKIGLCMKKATVRQSAAKYRSSEDSEGELPRRPLHRIEDYPTPNYETWEVLAVNPFTSDRKRMSVVYRDPTDANRLVLICKGADNQMLSVANKESYNAEETKGTLLAFAESGLRTLVVAERVIPQQEFDSWEQLHQAACKCVGKERKKQLDAIACKIEVNLNVLGITAVEDRLQDGVPQAISVLRQAKINFWLITGDKVETAINIGHSSELLNHKSKLVMLTAKELGIGDEAKEETEKDGERNSKESVAEVQSRLLDTILRATIQYQPTGDDEEIERERKGLFLRCILFFKKRLESDPVKVDPDLAMVLDGEVCQYILAHDKHKNEKLEAAFLELARMCSVVIACRASPAQKSQLVKVVKDNVYPTPTTLAIGDGANDVPMIETGHVGVGISGKEGTHAANAADFTIGQFKFLVPLLLVHGRYGYIRVAKAIGLVFFANLLFTFITFFYSFVCAFSGTPAFSNIQYVVFQAFIAVPVFVIGGLDRDRKDVYDTLKTPRCYDVGRLNQLLHPAFVDSQIFRGLIMGAIAFILVFYNDYDATYQMLSQSLFLVVTFVLTVRQANVAASYTWWMLAAILFNIIFCLLLTSLWMRLVMGVNIFSLHEAGRYFWNQLIATTLIVALLDFLGPIAMKFLRGNYYKIKTKMKEDFVGDDGAFPSMSRLFHSTRHNLTVESSRKMSKGSGHDTKYFNIGEAIMEEEEEEETDEDYDEDETDQEQEEEEEVEKEVEKENAQAQSQQQQQQQQEEEIREKVSKQKSVEEDQKMV